MSRPPPLPCCISMCAALLFAGCTSSKSKKEQSTGAATSRLSRLHEKGFDRKTGNLDHSIRSQFDQKTYAARGKVKEEKFRTGKYSGKHDYTGAGGYKAKEFSQADKMSREGEETFTGSGKTSKEADKEFSAKESRYGGQMARQGDKSFAGADDTFKTRAVSDVAKSQKNEQRPLMIPKDDASGKSVYSESDVKRMVNRN